MKKYNKKGNRSNMTYASLKNSTEYSITESSNKISNLIEKAKAQNIPAIAITDKNSLHGSIKFYKEAVAAGVKPIIGMNAIIESSSLLSANVPLKHTLTLLAKNNKGYKEIIKLNSRAYTDNLHIKKDTPVYIKEDWLKEVEPDNGIIVLSGGESGLIGQLILQGNMHAAKEVATQMSKLFGEDFYIELERLGTETESTYIDGAIEICQELNIAPVATNHSFFLNQDNYFGNEVRHCISHKQKIYDLSRVSKYTKEMYLKNPNEFHETFSDIQEAINNTLAIAQKCNLEIELDKPMLPNYPTPNGISVGEHFANISRKGLNARLQEIFPDPAIRESKRKEYESRLEWEIKTIQDMDFPGYFLIVYDFINYSRSQDIPVGPGRGSGAGSLVAYSLRITDIDPLPYNLLFERFLNPERVSMPDFDIDFCQSRRGEVYEYIKHRYGEEAVCQIGTFGTMGAKGAIKDVGRALGYNINYVNGITSLINISTAAPIPLKDYVFGNPNKDIPAHPELSNLYEYDGDLKKLIDLSCELEGTVRQLGTHAAGVVISPTTINDFSPVFKTEKVESPISQFDKNDIESSGLVKFDLLGLANLTIIKEAEDLINHRINIESKERKTSIQEFSIDKINISDLNVYQHIYASGNTGSIFQFESKGMVGVLRKAEPTKLEDLIAINALYRPGPMDIIPQWLEMKKLPEEQRTYPHPMLRGILSETYTFMVYQEQVMQTAQIIAGYSLGGADMLRRAMGKKDHKKMAQEREKFVQGAAKNNVNEQDANTIFDTMEKFAGYGFNKSHAAAYSYLSYQTAYLKYYYPTEFFTATLNNYIKGSKNEDSTAKLYQTYSDARKNGIEILPIDINESELYFSTKQLKKIRLGFGALKGAASNILTNLVEERNENGPYTSFRDVVERNRASMNKVTFLAMIRAGAFDSLNPNRSQLAASRDAFFTYAKKLKTKDDEENPISLLGNPDSLFGRATRVNTSTTSPLIPLLAEDVTLATDEDSSTLTKAEKSKISKGLWPIEINNDGHITSIDSKFILPEVNTTAFNLLMKSITQDPPVILDVNQRKDVKKLYGITHTNIKQSKRKDIVLVAPELEESPEWDGLTTANMEKTALGYYLTSNPFNEHYLPLLGNPNFLTMLSEIKINFDEELILNGETEETAKPRRAIIAGLIEDVYQFKNGSSGSVTINDGGHSFTVTLFKEEWAAMKADLKPNKFFAASITNQYRTNRNEEIEFSSTARKCFNLDKFMELIIKNILIASDTGDQPETIEKIDEICKEYGGVKIPNLTNAVKTVNQDNTSNIIFFGPGQDGRNNQMLFGYKIKASSLLVEKLLEITGRVSSQGRSNIKVNARKLEEIDKNILYAYKNNGNKKQFQYRNKSQY